VLHARLAPFALAACVLCGHPQQEKPLSFDAASIKRHQDNLVSNPNITSKNGGAAPLPQVGSLLFRQGTVISGRRGITVRGMILEAYLLSSPQLSGGTGWLSSDSFDVEAKAENANEAQLRAMLQTFLAERLRLVAHWRKQSLAIYTIELPRDGTRLHEWKVGDRVPMPTKSHAMNFRSAGTLQDLAKSLSSDPRIGRPVLDMTGLRGSYIYSFGWDTDDEFLSALQAQLGLRLRADKASMDILVIDRIDKPTPN
jgi:uncharacterized protein (TIGR03435 family)